VGTIRATERRTPGMRQVLTLTVLLLFTAGCATSTPKPAAPKVAKRPYIPPPLELNDTDGDGIPDIDDKCPRHPETFNGRHDEDGCPDRKLVHPVDRRIFICEKVYFADGKTAVPKNSVAMLKEVAMVMLKFPKLLELVVEGHADDSGGASTNARLARDRARAVHAQLIGLGVEPARLTLAAQSNGMPRRKVVQPSDRDYNRRVEFIVKRVKGAPGQGTRAPRRCN